jgi:protein-tyrosine phosphatase
MSVDFTWITERLATGAQITSKDDITTLIQAGITHIIDMRAEYNDGILDDARVILLWLPQQDDGTPRDPTQVRLGITFALGVALSKVGNRVLCHCAAGMNRGPLQTFAILRAMGLPQQEAIDRIRTKRPQVDFYNHPNYISSVEAALV